MAEIHGPIPGDKPVLAMNIDGVFIVTREDCPAGYLPVPGATYQFYNPDHAGWLHSLAEDFDPVYVSAHGMHSHRDMSELYDIPEFDWVDYRLFSRRAGDFNYDRRSALAVYFAERQIAWVDGELRHMDHAWAKFRNVMHSPTAIIKTETREGLQRKHVDLLRLWLGSLASRKS